MNCKYRFRERLIDSLDRKWSPQHLVYLDNNASTPIDPSILRSLEDSCKYKYGNPSSMHQAGLAAWNSIESVRQKTAKYISLAPEGIHFCSSATEALHTALTGLVLRNKNHELISTNIEHSALSKFFYMAKRIFKIPVHILAVDKNGQIPLEDLEQCLARSRNPILAISPVNHETGALHSLLEYSQVLKKHRGLLVLDAVQAFARQAPEYWAPYADILAFSGHKIYAPKGVAVLWVRRGLRLHAHRFGGEQEHGLFPGTENVPAIAALGAAIEIYSKEAQEFWQIQDSLIKDFIYLLEHKAVPFILESPPNRAHGIINISFPWLRNMEDFLYSLNEAGICLSRFSACSTKLSGASEILRNMGRSADSYLKSIRIATGRFNKREDLIHLAKFIGQEFSRSGPKNIP